RDGALDLPAARRHACRRALRGEPRDADPHGAWPLRRPDSHAARAGIARVPAEARLRSRMARLSDAAFGLRARNRRHLVIPRTRVLIVPLGLAASSQPAQPPWPAGPSDPSPPEG